MIFNYLESIDSGFHRLYAARLTRHPHTIHTTIINIYNFIIYITYIYRIYFVYKTAAKTNFGNKHCEIVLICAFEKRQSMDKRISIKTY